MQKTKLPHKFRIGHFVKIKPESASARWFTGLGPFRIIKHNWACDDDPWVILRNLDGSLCHSEFGSETADADPEDLVLDEFLTAVKRATNGRRKTRAAKAG